MTKQEIKEKIDGKTETALRMIISENIERELIAKEIKTITHRFKELDKLYNHRTENVRNICESINAIPPFTILRDTVIYHINKEYNIISKPADYCL